mmetsp:Transcript_4401/g.6402  ORF Transcript_4401/g.6402 Transcript_4401/m.6402 type:complete len:94 (-) Transcript_4401:416-697(-)
MRESHKQKEKEVLEESTSDVNVNIGDLDMNNLIKQKDNDVEAIERLQQKVDDYNSRMTVGHLNGTFNNTFNNTSKFSTESQRQMYIDLQKEIE